MKRITNCLLVIVLSVCVLLSNAAMSINAGDSVLNKPGDPVEKGPQYSLEQSMSDSAQLYTIAFNGMAFITGSAGADTFFPPGKVADFFGFQYMRDVDTAGYGHNTTFLSRIANNVLYILNDSQKAKLIALAKVQAPLYVNFAYNRFPLMNAFRKSLEGKEPQGSTGLNQKVVAQYTSNLYIYDAELSYNRAVTVGQIISSFSEEQKAYLAKMEFNNYNTWPDIQEDENLKKSMSNSEFVAVMTYASELFSWYKGGVDPDVYFCPERHGTYFGGFFLKDYPAMNNPDYFIGTDLTGESGRKFLEILDANQRSLINSIVQDQKSFLNEVAQNRTSVVAELRKAMTGGSVDKEKVFSLIKRYGELDGIMSGLYAARYAAVNKTLTQNQRTALVALRNLDAVPQGAYLFASPVGMPELPNNDYFFGIGTMPADAGQTKAPDSFKDTKDENRPPPPPPGSKKYTDSPFDGTIVLGAPSQNSVKANITANKTCQVYFQWGEKSNEYNQKNTSTEASNLKPAVLVMNNLKPGKKYYYRLFFKLSNEKDYKTTKEYTFQTPRNLGEPYSFVVQSDSHLLNKADKDLYTKSMQTMLSMNPDFLFDLGDTFLNDQGNNTKNLNFETIRQTSFQQRSFMDILTRNAYLFLVLGNHEGEYGYLLDSTEKNLAAMSTLARKTYYPNPEPNEFYSGNTESEKSVGNPQNYYAFQWGDALYVVIDPYRYTMMDPYNNKDGWGWSLGKTQYDWFRKTLETSQSKYKFVFAHHAIGNIRGGKEISKLFEWGGYDKNGKYLFDQKRPGWGKPIHQVMRDANVSVFFQGHDHLFSRESVDGIVYQTLPKPAEKIPDQESNFSSYPQADVLLNSGFLKVDVTTENVKISYYRNYFVSTEPQEGNTGIVYSYTVDSSHIVNVLQGKKDDISKYGGSDNGKKKKENKNSIQIEIDGKIIEIEDAPFIDSNGRIQVPLRVIAENLGCQVLWEENGKKNSITIKKEDITIELTIGKKVAYVNGKEIKLDTAPIIRNNKTFVPIRFIGETLGATIEWDAENKILRIKTKKSESGIVLATNQIALGYPTDHSISGKAIASFDLSTYFAYGVNPGQLETTTEIKSYKQDELIEFSFDDLLPNTAYFYEMRVKKPGSDRFDIFQAGSFRTQRSSGEEFQFTIQSDSHRDENTDINLYKTTLSNIQSEKPDFHIDLGDTFMGEKYSKSKEDTQKRYLEDRAYFSAITGSIPLFLVNGNHDGECGWNQQKNKENISLWASTFRKYYFPTLPFGSFYSSSSSEEANNYAFIWGDALFVMLDPYWYTMKKLQNNEDGWVHTLGKQQYDWLNKTLDNDQVHYKFVFLHNLVGGYGKDSRGGAEAAKYFEWGGKNFDGSDGFSKNRPGWEKPIHQLFVDNQVTAVFHGHDHFYAKQELDGIIYQLIPQPGHPGSEIKNASEYSYLEGLFLPSSGHLRITVTSSEAKIEYIKSSLGEGNNSILDAYVVYPRNKSTKPTNLTYPIVDTMQNECFDNRNLIDCPKTGEAYYGQDAQFIGNQASFSKSKDNLTILDNITGLTWQSSPDTDFDGKLTFKDKLTWEKIQLHPAILNAKKVGGYDDWRLPTIKELYSLIDFRGTDPSGPSSVNPKPFIDTKFFTFIYGDTNQGERLIDSQWASSNLYKGKAMNADGGKLFGVNFADGRIKGYGLKMPPNRPPKGLVRELFLPGGSSDKTFFLLCVRGNPDYGKNQYKDNLDLTITDQSTGLMWTKFDSGKGYNWQEALAWAQQKNKENYLGYHNWRLPNAKELQSLVDYQKCPDFTNSAAIDAVFHCTEIKNEAGVADYPWYWTNTTHIQSNGGPNGIGSAAVYICFGRATGYMDRWDDVHGAGAQRSDPKSGNPADFAKGRGPQGDGIRIYNYVRLVRDI